eukprot:m.47586 g.47586  ORF g.47586 m.47586 type:complete len:135 (+) comp12334_c1_seq2:568-972(+)
MIFQFLTWAFERYVAYMPHAFAGCIGAGLAFTAIGLDAYGAHKLKERVSDVKLHKTWENACRYQLIHGVALCACSGPNIRHRTVILFALGTFLFSGSIFADVLLFGKECGPTTTAGAALLQAGWASIAVDFLVS